jgi:hypothetical protein
VFEEISRPDRSPLFREGTRAVKGGRRTTAVRAVKEGSGQCCKELAALGGNGHPSRVSQVFLEHPL